MNPLVLQPQKTTNERKLPSSCAILIFGATGDLTQRKIIPALYHLFKRGQLPKQCPIICFARREFTDQGFAKVLHDSFITFTKKKPDPVDWSSFTKHLSYLRGNFDDVDAFSRLKEKLVNITGNQSQHVLYYFATAPEFFGSVVESLHKQNLAQGQSGPDPWPRLIFEKPFGHDLASAQDLNRRIGSVFDETQIFRIDHYLGKETVQNILVMRFANSIYEQLWNNRYIDNIQITSAESIGVEGRGGYYDFAGALRDMVQNHLMQLLTYVAMEPPLSLNADDIREEKVKVLKSLLPISEGEAEKCAVRAQYASGTAEGKKVPGYLQEPDIPKQSKTETFAALCMHVHNWRWEGVPFFLRTGKRLARRTTEIVVTFKPAPGVLFNDPRMGTVENNRLIIRIQPDEGIGLRFNSKRPVTELHIDPVMMDFCHSCIFSPNTPEAYERLLHDALVGDSTLFTRWDEVEHAWAFIDPIRKAWDRQKKQMPTYTAGTWGPKESDDLIASTGRTWFDTLR